MLVNLHHGSPAEHRKLLVAGVAFLTSIALLVALSIAVYLKVFEPVTMITVKADRAGLQLATFGDVRVNGALVGQVRSVGQDGDQASIEIGLRPEAAREIPANVSVEILPTTLFGQKYVALVLPRDPAVESLQPGQVIGSDRVETNVELSQVLANLFPLLRSVRPADLNATLHALATALDGRGEQLGSTMDDLGVYLEAIDDELPTLREDLRLLADVAHTYNLAAPDLIEVLRNVTVTSRTVLERREDLASFFGDLTGLSVTATRVLGDNEALMIRAGEVTEPVTDLLAVYSPEFPCLLQGLDRYDEFLADMFSGQRVKQFVELGALQREAYEPEDRPVYGELGHGPNCRGLPFPQVPAGPSGIRNGDDQSIHEENPFSILQGDARPVSMGYAGTEPEQQIVSAMLASSSGRSVDDYGSFSALVYGPLVKGAEVRG